MNETDDSSPGYRIADVGSGPGGGDEEPTLVIIPRIPRPTISRGVKLLATSFGELRKSLFEFVTVFDDTTALGALEMTPGEAHELADFLRDAKRRINGVLSSLPRAVRPPTIDLSGNFNKENP